MATRPSKLDITGNFFQSSDRFFGFPYFSRKSHDPAPQNFISKSVRIWQIYLLKSTLCTISSSYYFSRIKFFTRAALALRQPQTLKSGDIPFHLLSSLLEPGAHLWKRKIVRWKDVRFSRKSWQTGRFFAILFDFLIKIFLGLRPRIWWKRILRPNGMQNR